jgi:hypothetical protein
MMTTTADFLAQVVVLSVILVSIRHRHILADMSDGNVERLERERIHSAARAAQARMILWRMLPSAFSQ